MNTFITLLLAASLSAGDPGTLIPLTPTEAAALGLDAADGMMYRNIAVYPGVESAPAKNVNGTTQSLTLSAREQRGGGSDAFLNETADGRWCESGSTNAFGDIVLQLPHGNLVTSMRIWGLDASANNLTVSLIERCTPNNTSGSVFTSVISEITSTGNSGNFSLVTAIGANNTIDNDACSYTLRTRYSTPGDASICAGSPLRLQKIRMGYEAP